MPPPGAAAIAEPVDVGEFPPLGDLATGEIELFAGDEIDRARPGEAGFRFDRDLGPDQSDREPWVGVLQRLGDFHIGGEGRGRGMQHDQLVITGERQHVVKPQPRRRGVDQPAARHQRGGLREPCRVPEGSYLPPRLIARARPAIETVERRRV